jgi:hypothetical protein
MIIFPKFTEAKLPSYSPHGTLFSFGHVGLYWTAPLIIALCLVPQPDPVAMPSEFVEGETLENLIKRCERRKLWEALVGFKWFKDRECGCRMKAVTHAYV